MMTKVKMNAIITFEESRPVEIKQECNGTIGLEKYEEIGKSSSIDDEVPHGEME